MDPEWLERATCRHDPEAFFPDASDDVGIAAAQRICHTCPVFLECRAYTDHANPSYGVFAARFYNRLDWRPKREAPCGTEAGSKRHRRNGEQPCRSCQAAASRAQAERKQRRDTLKAAAKTQRYEAKYPQSRRRA